MLEKMREGAQGPTAKIVIVVIILSFTLAGIGGYLGGSSAPVAVVVNDVEISTEAVDQAYQNERSRLQEQYGEQFDMLASTPNFNQQIRQQATQTVISEHLITQAVNDMGLRIGDQQIKQEIRQMQEFEVDGKFNNDRYLSLLRRAGYTPLQFSKTLKQDLGRRQLLTMVTSSEFSLPIEVELVKQLQAQQRIAKVLTVNVNDFVKNTPISEAEIAAYYDANSQLFQTSEQVSVNYVLLDEPLLTEQVTLSDAEIEEYYDIHQSDYERSERRKVAHILLAGDNNEVKEKAQVILSELENGADFKQLAAQKSDDTFSAKNNGELDWFERGVMDPAFDDAAFTLTQDAPLSGLVKSKFGYHIIKLVAIQESKKRPFSEVSEQVELALKKQKRSALYYDLQLRLSEVAFEMPNDLEEAAYAVRGEVQRSEFFSAENAPDALSDSAILKIVFDTKFREDGMNSELIELSENKAIVVRVNGYQSAALKPLADVSEQITAQLQAQKSRNNAQDFVELLMVKLNAQESIDSLLADKDMAFSDDLTFTRDNRELDYRVMQAVFKLAKPVAQQARYDWVETSTGNFALIELNAVNEVEPEIESNDDNQKIAQMLQRLSSESTYQALLKELTDNADIKYPAQ